MFRKVSQVAESQRSADVAARTSLVEYDTENIDSPILTIEEAVDKCSFFQIPSSMYPKQVGDFSKGMAEADHKILSAEMRLGSEYFFYMETQTALAIPDEDDCMVVYTSSQYPEDAHHVIAICLGVPEHNIRVITRVGGGFGGKCLKAMPVSIACALAAYQLRRPVRVYVNRNSDMIMTGGRHPMKVTYSVGFKSSRKITALHLDILINAGITEDMSPILPLAIINSLKNYDWGALSFDVRQMTASALGLIESSWTKDLMKNVRFTQADSLSLVQGGYTGGSTTSESNCEAARLCCDVLVERLTPLKKQLQEQNGSVDWPMLISQAQLQSVNLAANSYYVPESSSSSYLNFGAAVSEVEIDILTGETTILQSDIIYDCGQSLNPAVDMGQFFPFNVDFRFCNLNLLLQLTDASCFYAVIVCIVPSAFLSANSNQKDSWIIDSRATNHMTGNSRASSTYTPCTGNNKIKIADGSLSTIARKVTVKLSPFLTLHDILHVPKLSCNLVSISKLIRSLNYRAIFDSDDM
ncbi:Lyk3 precursor [Capsicum annuum]|nr:Lyk3 precursor [Capsicum annuum]KAF3681278.1 Lyk3 precursor [Capsicum annuum]